MKIQWFPGHMTKALRLMRESVKAVDIIGYVLDARAPNACLNPEFETLTDRKPCLIILNKVDLADNAKVEKWKNYFESKGKTTVVVSSVNINKSKTLTSAFMQIAKPVTERYAKKGVFKPVRAMIIGVPNSGKSTLINCVSTRKLAVTGDRPGVTKGKQWVRLSNGIELMDTPGTLWPKFIDDMTARHLVYIGSIKDDIIDINEAAALFLEEMSTLYPEALKERYGISDLNKKPYEILLDICVKRGFILRGGEYDEERCAKAVLDDFRKGRLGKITLETP
ncbi:MAG TPA: ribosome biogenesis GTPase YlqF [Clostridia bacterium]|nr:ribosome biogenesis GTPase YlqF [Clostridia bacterium]